MCPYSPSPYDRGCSSCLAPPPRLLSLSPYPYIRLNYCSLSPFLRPCSFNALCSSVVDQHQPAPSDLAPGGQGCPPEAPARQNLKQTAETLPAGPIGLSGLVLAQCTGNRSNDVYFKVS